MICVGQKDKPRMENQNGSPEFGEQEVSWPRTTWRDSLCFWLSTKSFELGTRLGRQRPNANCIVPTLAPTKCWSGRVNGCKRKCQKTQTIRGPVAIVHQLLAPHQSRARASSPRHSVSTTSGDRPPTILGMGQNWRPKMKLQVWSQFHG